MIPASLDRTPADRPVDPVPARGSEPPFRRRIECAEPRNRSGSPVRGGRGPLDSGREGADRSRRPRD